MRRAYPQFMAAGGEQLPPEVLDKLDVKTTWTKMEALGLPHSKIHSKTFRRQTSVALDSSVVYGLGVTTPDEVLRVT